MARRKKGNLHLILARQIVRQQLNLPGPVQLDPREEIIYEIYTCLDNKIKTGQPFAIFNREINTYLFAKGVQINKEKLESLYHIYSFLFNEAQHYLFNLKSTEIFSYWQYHTYGGLCKSEFCKSLDGKIFLFNNKLWDIIYPPNHPECKATVRLLSKDQFENNNLTLTDADYIAHPHPDWAINIFKTDWKNFFYKFASKTLRISKRAK